MKEKNILAFILMFMCMLVPSTMSAQDSAYKRNTRFPFIIITKDTVQQQPKFTDEEFYQISSGVVFKQNSVEIPANDSFMTIYRDSVLPWVNKQHLQLRKVFVRGAASPEGPFENNVRLGKGRSKALLEELRKDLLNQYIEMNSEVSSITEDYGYLCLLMEREKDKDYPRVKKAYDECQGNELCLKQTLSTMDDGRLWKRLQSRYFSRLRTAHVILWFSEPDKEHAPVVVEKKAEQVIISKRDTIYKHDTLVVIKKVVIDSTIIMEGKTHKQRFTAKDSVLRHPILALKTNLLFDAATLLNGEIEVPIGKRFSVMAECVWPWWLEKKHNKWCIEMGSVGVEGRYWFSQWKRHSTFADWKTTKHAPLRGWFMGVYANCGYYDFQLKRNNGSQGEFLGGGISGGYSTYIARRWRMEFSLGAGAAYYKDRKYFIEDNTPTDPNRDQHLWKDGGERKRMWFGPTKVKISLTYLITGKCKKGGKR